MRVSRSSVRGSLIGAGLLFAFAVAAACGNSGKGGGFAAPGSDAGGAADATLGEDANTPNLGNQDSGPAQSLAISPAGATLTVTSLTAPFPTQAFTANATFSGGAVAATQATWSLDRLDIASIDPNGGVLTPSGGTFGVVTVTATALGLTATTTITVVLNATIDTAGLTPPQESTLAGATTPDPAVTSLAYPYNATVFPAGLIAPQLMWNGGAAGDVYYVNLVGPSFNLSLFTAADPPSRFTMPQAAWNALTASAAGASATCALHRLTGGTAYASASETWKIADANLSGTIYYWAINEGQIFQINLTAGTVSPAFDAGPSASLGTPTPINSGSPTSPPWQDNGSGNRCVACHSVSKDGSTLTSIFSRGTPGSTGPLGFYNFATGAIETISDYTQDGTYDALTPDGQFAVMNLSSETMQFMSTAAATTTASGLDGIANLCDPTFSPDGTLFALSADCTGGAGYPVEFDSSNLGLYAFSETTAPYFTNPQTVIQGSGAGDAIAFPSFSPDSKFIFYQRGSYSRAKYSTASDTYDHGVDDLYVAPAQAGATQVELANANGAGVLPADSLHLNYAPTVNPIAAGGYIWVVFTSPRDYGNIMVSPQGTAPNDATYSNHKQLWVTAVDANIGATDPSHPAFWLPGQDQTSANMFGYWALAPCEPTPTDGGAPPTCSAGFECCTGFCRQLDDGGAAVCTGEPTGCHQEGEKCTTTADCCGASANIQCQSGICQAGSPK
jgi:hypothetical protein